MRAFETIVHHGNNQANILDNQVHRYEVEGYIAFWCYVGGSHARPLKLRVLRSVISAVVRRRSFRWEDDRSDLNDPNREFVPEITDVEDVEIEGHGVAEMCWFRLYPLNPHLRYPQVRAYEKHLAKVAEAIAEVIEGDERMKWVITVTSSLVSMGNTSFRVRPMSKEQADRMSDPAVAAMNT